MTNYRCVCLCVCEFKYVIIFEEIFSKKIFILEIYLP